MMSCVSRRAKDFIVFELFLLYLGRELKKMYFSYGTISTSGCSRDLGALLFAHFFSGLCGCSIRNKHEGDCMLWYGIL